MYLDFEDGEGVGTIGRPTSSYFLAGDWGENGLSFPDLKGGKCGGSGV